MPNQPVKMTQAELETLILNLQECTSSLQTARHNVTGVKAITRNDAGAANRRMLTVVHVLDTTRAFCESVRV